MRLSQSSTVGGLGGAVQGRRLAVGPQGAWTKETPPRRPIVHRLRIPQVRGRNDEQMDPLKLDFVRTKRPNGQLQNMSSIEVGRYPSVPIDNHVRVKSRRSHRKLIAIPTQDSQSIATVSAAEHAMRVVLFQPSRGAIETTLPHGWMDGRPCVRFNRQVLIHTGIIARAGTITTFRSRHVPPVFNSRCYQCVGKECFLLLPCTLQTIAPETPLLVCPITRYATRTLLQKQTNR